MGKKKAASAPSDFGCSSAGCPVTGRDKVKKCAQCLAVWYCSPECQRQHWRRSGGNRKAFCKPEARRSIRAGGGTAKGPTTGSRGRW